MTECQKWKVFRNIKIEISSGCKLYRLRFLSAIQSDIRVQYIDQNKKFNEVHYNALTMTVFIKHTWWRSLQTFQLKIGESKETNAILIQKTEFGNQKAP